MRIKPRNSSANPTVWASVDLEKVKQRLNKITERIEKVLPPVKPKNYSDF